MNKFSKLAKLFDTNSVSNLVCELDLSLANTIEICLRNERLSLGIYFESYNIHSLKLFEKILDLANVSSNLKSEILLLFTNKNNAGLTVDNNTLKIYHRKNVSGNSTAYGIDYSLLTEKIIKTKKYILNNTKDGFELETKYSSGKIHNGLTKSIDYKSKQFTMSDIYNYVKNLKLDIIRCYKRENGQEYILINT